MATQPPGVTHTGNTPGNAVMRRPGAVVARQATQPGTSPLTLFHTGEDPPARVQQTNIPVQVARAPAPRF